VPMRKLILILLASVLIPAAASAGRDTSGDGSLVVSNADGRLTIQGRGLIFGHLDHGTITIIGDYKPEDITALPSVSGAKLKVRDDNVVYVGNDVRFLFPSGRYTLIVEGTNIDISAVGRGKFTAISDGGLDNGSFTVDGGRAQLIGTTGTVQYGIGNSSSNSNSNSGKGRSAAASA
jgi:hypothetical protein